MRLHTMTTSQFIAENIGNLPKRDKQCSSVYQFTDGNFYSYGSHYPLLFKIGNLWLRNTQGYSASTAKHISWCAGHADHDVKLISTHNSIGYSSDAISKKNILDSLYKEQKEVNEEYHGLTRRNTQKEQRIVNRLNELENAITAVKAQSVE